MDVSIFCCFKKNIAQFAWSGLQDFGDEKSEI